MRDLRKTIRTLFQCPPNRNNEERVVRAEKGADGLGMEEESHYDNEAVNTSPVAAGRWRQYYASFIVSLAAFGAGLGGGWASPILLLLKSDDSPVGKMTLQEMSYLETLPTFTGLIGIFLFGAIVDKYGRKPVGYVVSVFAITGWCTLIFARQPYHLFVGRAFTGVSAVGGFMVGAIYLSEVVHESRRGALMSYLMFTSHMGTLLAYVLGDALSYLQFNVSCSVAPLIFSFLFVPLPETPYFLNSKSRVEEARKSLLWFRSGNVEVADQELISIKNVQRPNASCMDLFRSKGTRKAILILVFMFSFQQIGGAQIVAGYASIIFEDAGNEISANKSAIIIVVIKVCSTYASILLVDRVGRRVLMITMFLVMSICLAGLSIYLYERQFGHFNLDHLWWLPLVSLGSFNVAASLGVGTLAEVIGNEVVPTEIKGLSSMVSGTITMSVMILCLQAYPFIQEHVGSYANFTYPAAFNLLGGIITYFLIPETKGKSLEEISALLNR